MKPVNVMLLTLLAGLLALLWPITARADGAPTTCPHDPVAQLAGRIVLDIDHDNWPDANEGLPGIPVTLRRGETTLQETVTDPEGCYRFNRYLLQTGALHRVRWSGIHASNRFIHDPDNGIHPGTQYYVFVAGAAQPSETDVVYRPASVPPYLTHCPYAPYSASDLGGMVAIDANQNQQADPGEGVAGTIVTLAVSSPDYIVAQATTDANGCYRMPRDPQSVARARDRSGVSLAPHEGVLMFVRAYLPAGAGPLVESYDPNGRQTAHRFYALLSAPNGTLETDFLYRAPVPSAVDIVAMTARPGKAPSPGWALPAAVLFGVLVVGITRGRGTSIVSRHD